MSILNDTTENHKDELADMAGRPDLDIRMVSALAGDRNLNEREKQTLLRLKEERGDGIYSDLLYALTYRSFPSKQAKHLWDEITNHRSAMKTVLGRDIGIGVAAHDYLTNVSNLLNSVAVIEESKMSSFANTASKDGLTGLYDQTTFKHRLKDEMERQIRYGNTFTLVMFDLDHFKSVNDNFGHAEGDIVLKKLALLLDEQNRIEDIVARIGGEEFVILLNHCDADEAIKKAQSLRIKIAELNC